MIGGMMLLCAVAAMLLLATWSLARDDDPDAKPRDGILALRIFTDGKRRRAPKQAQPRRRAGPAPRQNVTARKPRPIEFDPDEMAEIAEEAEATLPKFIRNAREKY